MLIFIYITLSIYQKILNIRLIRMITNKTFWGFFNEKYFISLIHSARIHTKAFSLPIFSTSSNTGSLQCKHVPFPFLLCTINWFGRYCNQFLKLGHQLLVYLSLILCNLASELCNLLVFDQPNRVGSGKLSNMIYFGMKLQYPRPMEQSMGMQSNHGNSLILVQCTSCRRKF